MIQKARIIKIVSNQYTVFFNEEVHIATAMGKLRMGLKPLVGDFVELEYLENHWVIQRVLERKNELKRPLVANVDQTLIVMSAKEPDFSTTLVDRLIFLVAVAGIEPIIVINKTDLVDEKDLEIMVNEYKNYGYQVITTYKNGNADEIVSLLKDKVTVLAGQSGVGKSSIINRIDNSFELQTQEISKVLGRGKHTTRHNQLYGIRGGWIADTPGFSSLDFSHITKLELAQTVPDFKELAFDCRFRNCLHQSEPGCKIKEMLNEGKISQTRYEHYLECLELTKEDSHG